MKLSKLNPYKIYEMCYNAIVEMKNIVIVFILFIVISGILIIPALIQSSYALRKYRQGSGSMMLVIHLDDLITVDDEYSFFKKSK